MDPQLLTYYEAIERASADMLDAARAGNWDEVVKLEGACVLLISQLKHAAQEPRAASAPTARPARLEPFAVTMSEPCEFDAVGLDAGAADCADAAGADVELVHAARPARSSTATAAEAEAEAARAKARIMQRILVNDAEIRQLAEPWLQTLDEAMQGRRRTLH